MRSRAAVLLLALLAGARALAAAEVLVARVDGAIQDVQAEIVADALAEARDTDAALLVLELDTPGGLETSMRAMAQGLLASPVPVAVLVTPSGARAASAGFFLLMAGDVAAMAEGTTTGAAHPVLAIGGLVPVKPDDLDPTLLEKTTNDSLAFLRATAASRGHDPEQAVRAITENRTWTAAEAVDADLVDLVARDAADLVQRLDGRTLARVDGPPVTLALEGATLRRLEPSWRQHLLLFLSEPMLAFLLALAGLALLYVEVTHAGAVVPGVAGGLCLVLSLLGFSFLPISAVGVLLIVGGLGLLAVEVFVPGFLVFGIGGAVALAFGAVLLVRGPIPELRIPFVEVLGLVAPFAVLVVVLGRLAQKAHGRRAVTGAEGMPGQVGEVRRTLDPEGLVFVEGELWRAVASGGVRIEPPARVVVRRVEGLTVVVDPLPPEGATEEGP